MNVFKSMNDSFLVDDWSVKSSWPTSYEQTNLEQVEKYDQEHVTKTLFIRFLNS